MFFLIFLFFTFLFSSFSYCLKSELQAEELYRNISEEMGHNIEEKGERSQAALMSFCYQIADAHNRGSKTISNLNTWSGQWYHPGLSNTKIPISYSPEAVFEALAQLKLYGFIIFINERNGIIKLEWLF